MGYLDKFENAAEIVQNSLGGKDLKAKSKPESLQPNHFPELELQSDDRGILLEDGVGAGSDLLPRRRSRPIFSRPLSLVYISENFRWQA